MKKIALSLAGVLAAAAFAPEASALPVFARQTGMACLACHFNHAPLLNGFGRAFKSAGYTMMGSQGKVEGEGLDIPDRLNMAVLTTAGYEKATGGTSPAPRGAYALPSSGGELSIFYGGRIMESMGFLSELGTGGGTAATGAAKLLYLPEVADGTRLGLVFDVNNGQGVAHGFEILNTGAVNVHKMAIGQTHVNVYSAAQWMGTNNATSGVSLVALKDIGYINFSAYDAAPQSLGAGATNLPLHYFRAAATAIDVAGFEMSGGLQRWYGYTTGTQFDANYSSTAVAPQVAAIQEGLYSATVIDFQAQGTVAGKSTGIYASYGVAPVNSLFGAGNIPGIGAVVVNAFDAKSLNIGVDMNLGHEFIGRAALRRATNGADGASDNAFMVGAIYELAQNVELHVTHTSNSGDHYAVHNPTATTKLTSIVAEILF